ncbi:MAG: phage tail sheath family protein [Anaerolineae bacterium]|nr:phage tail sheath family protein [Anaerolineae bacterium]
MPQNYNYPGIYIEEISSGVRTIAGVSTSDTAFVDFFKKGPIDDPVRITSYGDFERVFGGLDIRSAASYGIMQFFLNGGGVAWVVRVSDRNGSGAPTATSATLATQPTPGTLAIDASSPGTWANNRIRITMPSGASSGQFNLRVEEVVGNEPVNPGDPNPLVLATENYFNLSMTPTDSRYALPIVNSSSALVRLRHTNPATTTVPTSVPAAPGNRLVNGSDGTNVPGSTGWNTTTGAGALTGSSAAKTGLHALDKITPFIFNILCIPAAVDLETADMQTVYNEALTYAEGKRAFLIIDVPQNTAYDAMDTYLTDRGFQSNNAAIYYPRVIIPDALQGNNPREVASSGTLAGVYARTDAQRGVWKAPAGTEANMRNATVALKMSDPENGGLNPFGVNALRNFPIYSDVVWGARTINGADQKASEWKYIPVRRTALYIEESLYQGLKWVVFEPNDEPLWAQIRLNVGAFMNSLFRQGAFQGKTSREAYFVKCDRETTTQNDIDRGIVNIVVGFAPLKPVEFVVLKIQQIAGEIQV